MMNQLLQTLPVKGHESRTESSGWRTISSKWEVVCGRMINILTMGNFHHKKPSVNGGSQLSVGGSLKCTSYERPWFVYKQGCCEKGFMVSQRSHCGPVLI